VLKKTKAARVIRASQSGWYVEWFRKLSSYCLQRPALSGAIPIFVRERARHRQKVKCSARLQGMVDKPGARYRRGDSGTMCLFATVPNAFTENFTVQALLP
jgi:hypothetical protein